MGNCLTTHVPSQYCLRAFIIVVRARELFEHTVQGLTGWQQELLCSAGAGLIHTAESLSVTGEALVETLC